MIPAGHKYSFIEMCHRLLVCTGTKNGGAAHDQCHQIARNVRKSGAGLVLDYSCSRITRIHSIHLGYLGYLV